MPSLSSAKEKVLGFYDEGFGNPFRGFEMGSSSSSSFVTKWHPFNRWNFLFLFWTLFSCLNVVAPNDSEKAALLQFKNSMSDDSGLLSSWSLDIPNYCSWAGVTCDMNFHVVALNITGQGGNRYIPKNSSNGTVLSSSVRLLLYGSEMWRGCVVSNGILVGKLLPGIAKLSELRVLSLPFNEIGGEIPSEIWSLEKLEVLDLEGNLFSGSLPVSFTGLRNLRVLNLGFNMITGNIPGSLCYCESLEILSLSGNRITGSVPAYISRFRSVYLSLNRLNGKIPGEIADYCEKLEHLDLSGNVLLGEIPSNLGNCRNLRTLLLYANYLEEMIPREFGLLGNLEVLDVSRNSLSGPIPRELGNCSNLSALVLTNGFKPYEDGKSSRWGSSLDQFDPPGGNFNFFRGGVPVEILSLPNLRLLWAPETTLDGRLPSNWDSCDNLEMVNLAHNFFIGQIPWGFSRCRKLWFLDLSSNRFDGELITELPIPCMTVFDVSENALSGPIPTFSSSSCPLVPSGDGYPSSTFDMPSAYLSYFGKKDRTGGDGLEVFHNFGDNNFTGNLQSLPIAPARLGKQTTYTFLAGENKLTGPFPGMLFEKCGQLKNAILNVSNNRLYGQIPADIGTICRSLKLLDASKNQIVGSIPPSIGNLLSLESLNLSWNHLQGQIPYSIGQMKGLRFLSLAGNKLNGSVPSSMGELQHLEVLDLSSNLLSGEIPDALANLKNMSSLLLNDNKLCGQIPPALGNAYMVSAINLSSNNLSGPLPSGNNFMKCSSLLGNPYLRPCHVFSLAVSSPDLQGMTTLAQGYVVSPPSQMQRNGNTGFTSIERAAIASASAIVSVLLALIVLYLCTIRWRQRSKIAGSARKEVTIFKEIGFPITYDDIVRATGGFNVSNCIGYGGFGATYKAEIFPGVLVAIKRLAIGRFQGVQQFHAEIKTLGTLRNPNLVTLIGYHASETEMFLIYNYLPGGNLEKYIQERSTRDVDWRILHKIALDVARALAYLHDECVPRVLHRDVKPSNILLDDDFNAYLSDFGLARLLGTSETHATTGVAGTFGYVAPEYAMTCRVSDKADVYSYGVVLLELLSDKKALDPSFSPYGNGFNIVDWACMLLRQGKAMEFFTAGLWDAGPHDVLVEILHLAVVCTVYSLSTRPTMRQVVRRLKQLQSTGC